MTRRAAITAVGVMLLLALLTPAAVSPAQAHASLTRSDPADGAVLAAVPRQMVLTFNEAVSPLVLRLIDPLGNTKVLDPPADRAERLVVTLPELGKGTHLLSWRVVSLDGHPVGGSLMFSVGAPSTGMARPESTANRAVAATLWAAKLVVYLGLFVGIGGAFFATWIATPARPAGGTIATTIIAGLVALVFTVGLQGADGLEMPLAGLARKITWETGLETAYGPTAIVAAFALFAGLFALEARSQVLSLVALLGVGIALALSGHASAAAPQWLTRPAVFGHAIGVAFWIGSLPPLAVLLRRRDADAPRALATFSRWIPWPLLLLVVSGAALAVIQIERPDALVSTLYGQILVAKLAAVAALLALAAWNRFRLTPRAMQADAGVAPRSLSRSICAETIIVVAILALVSSWRFSPPPRALAAAQSEPALLHLHTLEALADITIAPGRAGPVSVTITVLTGNFGSLDAKEIVLTLENRGAGIEPITRAAIKRADGRWGVDALLLPVPGRWNLQLAILISDFDKAMLDGVVDIK